MLVGALALAPGASSEAQSNRRPSDPLAPYDQTADIRLRWFEDGFQAINDSVGRAQNEAELNAIAALVGTERRRTIAAFQAEMGSALRLFTSHRNTIQQHEMRLRELNAEIEAEKARVAAPAKPQEEIELENVITEVKGELAGLEGRQQRVAALEAKLQAMPAAGFMNSAPREALEAELAEARNNLPKQGEVEGKRTELSGYEAQLTAVKAKRPKPAASRVPELERQVRSFEKARAEELRAAAEAKKTFTRLRAQALGFVELFEWIESLIDLRRQALRGATGVAGAFVQCATMQGPFRCTGAFDGTWSSRCDGYNQDFHGPARVTFGPDGWVEVTMTDLSSANKAPTVIGGNITADGAVLIERKQTRQIETYRGKFSLVTSTLASGAAKPVGGGTYELRYFDDKGAVAMRCNGTMKLN